MKIRPIILCGGAGTRLWPDQKKNLPKQFVDFGGWTLIQKTLERIKTPIFDFPIISTNLKYLKKIRYFLKKNKINKYKIVLEPKKKNTAPAVLSSALIKDIPLNQPLVYFVADKTVKGIGRIIWPDPEKKIANMFFSLNMRIIDIHKKIANMCVFPQT